MNLWVALDWGTTNFRAYLMDDNKVVDQVSTQEGMKFVHQQNFENTLIKNIKRWNNNFNFKVIVASGMVHFSDRYASPP